MFAPEPHTTTPGHWLDHELFRGEDGSGHEYLLTVYRDGTRTLAVRPLGERTWSAPVLLEAVAS